MYDCTCVLGRAFLLKPSSLPAGHVDFQHAQVGCESMVSIVGILCLLE